MWQLLIYKAGSDDRAVSEITHFYYYIPVQERSYCIYTVSVGSKLATLSSLALRVSDSRREIFTLKSRNKKLILAFQAIKLADGISM